jgi:hypothetical protein
MASATTELATPDIREEERVAALEAALERSERRRQAAEEWAEFLERELKARDERLQAVIEQYEMELEAAKREQTEPTGFWARVSRWFAR